MAREDVALARNLLRRVAAAGCSGRFSLMQVCPLDAATHLPAFCNLIEFGYVERVTEAVGRWHYRLTPAAHAALAGEPLLFGEGHPLPEREYLGAAFGRRE